MPRTSQKTIDALDRECDLENIWDVCWDPSLGPKTLINQIRFFDPTTGQWVNFHMFPTPDDWPVGSAKDWLWQAKIIDWFNDPVFRKYLILKARQLGITLLACAYALWVLLFKPGSEVIAYSYREDEAQKLVRAAWMMFLCLPERLRSHVRVLTPKIAEMPTQYIELDHGENLISRFQALPATEKAGHGERVTFAIMDEMARMDYARGIYEAINPAISRGGKLAMVSTANGVSNLETGEGNFFHHLFATKEAKKLQYRFLPWNYEPTRDSAWYEEEAMALDEVERNRQYPLNERDAFMLSGLGYFDRDSLKWYEKNTMEPLYRGQFAVEGDRLKWMNLKSGVVEVYQEPGQWGRYALTCDAASGKAYDYTSVDVIDLESGAICAHMHAKIEASRAAEQIYMLGDWYNTALVAVERQGGWGDVIITHLRDGTKRLERYPNLYRHTAFNKIGKPISKEYGMPMGGEKRAQVLEELRTWIRRQLFPWMTQGHLYECQTFVYADTKPSPRAQDGTNDDRVFSLAMAVEIYRQKGSRPEKSPEAEQVQLVTRKPKIGRAYEPHPMRARV